MDEAIHAADVDERAEVGQAADDARDDLILLDLLPGLLLLVQQVRLAAGDNALLRLVHLDDLDGHRLAHELADVLDEAAGQVGSRDERTNTHHVGDQAAVDGLAASGFHAGAGVVFSDELLPVLGGHDLALRKEHIALAIVELDHFGLDLVVNLAVGGDQIVLLDVAISLAGNAHDNTVIAHLGDDAFDNLTGAELDHRLLEHRGKVLAAVRNQILFHVVHAGTTSSSISAGPGRPGNDTYFIGSRRGRRRETLTYVAPCALPVASASTRARTASSSHCGVDAPAVMAMRSSGEAIPSGTSWGVSTR